MRRRCRFLPALAFAALTAAAAQAQSWAGAIADDGNSAGGLITVGEKTLTLGCNRDSGPWMSVVLTGGPHPGMKNADDAADEMLMSITLPGKESSRHPVAGYFYEADDTFVGRLPTSEDMLRAFALGSALELTSQTGDLVFRAPMSGTGAFREQIRAACGI